MTGHAAIAWHASLASLHGALAATVDGLVAERTVGALPRVSGWCPVCRTAATFVVPGGPCFEDRPNLREGMRCARCRLTARQRLLYLAVAQTLSGTRGAPVAILERQSRLFRSLRRILPKLVGSEYLGDHCIPGRRYLHRHAGSAWRTSLLRHESITALSHAGASLAGLVHGDVLEHVRDTAGALQESARVLRPGGSVVFTVPFFPQSEATVHRGALDASGHRVDLHPPELHGDGVRPGGIYTWHNFGCDLFSQLQAHFARVEVGLLHDPVQGFLHADAVEGPWNMPPLVLRASRERRT